ncbi:MAG: hypothetical protein ACI9MR_002027 [Myxococcota bacterium]|jgi:hypothetical protein
MLAPVQPEAGGPVGGAGDVFAPRSGASKMPDAVCKKMESSFGADFSDVGLHSNPVLVGVGAKAAAAGADIHVLPGTDVTRDSGQALLGHELAHVQQQGAGRVSQPQGKGGFTVDHGLEVEADMAGDKAARTNTVSIAQGRGRRRSTSRSQSWLVCTKCW